MTMLPLLFLLVGDFAVNASVQDQSQPFALYALEQYYVFWYDMRYYSPDRSVFAARVTGNGTVIDTAGMPVLIDRTVDVAAAFNGTDFLVVIQDSC